MAQAVPAVPEETKFVSLPVLDLFEPAPVCNDTANGYTESVYPESGLRDSGGNITFRIVGTGDYIDPTKSYFVGRGKFKGTMPVTANGATTDTDISTITNPKFSWVNMLPQALFRSVDVSINNTNITNNDSHYGYRTILQTLVNATEATQQKYLRLSGCVKDEGTWDGIDEAATTGNPALAARRKNMNDDLEMFFTFDLTTPLFQMNKAILSGCDITVTLRKHDRPAFYMMHDVGAKIDFELEELVFKVRKITPMDHKALAIEQALKTKGSVTYVLDDPRLIVTSVPRGETYIHKEVATLGHNASDGMFAMVDTEAYNGNSKMNPFRFQHFDVSKITITKNGMIFPTQPIVCDFDRGNYVEAYRHFLAAIHADKNVHVPNISLEDFKNGAFIACWDMSPDQYGCTDPQMLVNKSTNIKLSIEFKKPLPKAITCFFLFGLSSRLIINQSRQVVLEQLA
jgi:hypothetical protein